MCTFLNKTLIFRFLKITTKNRNILINKILIIPNRNSLYIESFRNNVYTYIQTIFIFQDTNFLILNKTNTNFLHVPNQFPLKKHFISIFSQKIEIN